MAVAVKAAKQGDEEREKRVGSLSHPRVSRVFLPRTNSHLLTRSLTPAARFIANLSTC